MPASRPCPVLGCWRLQVGDTGRCAEHPRKPWATRPTSVKYDSGAWKALRAQVLREEPTCRIRRPGCTGKSTTAAHVESVADRPGLFLVRSNVMGSCWSCNHREASAKGGRR